MRARPSSLFAILLLLTLLSIHSLSIPAAAAAAADDDDDLAVLEELLAIEEEEEARGGGGGGGAAAAERKPSEANAVKRAQRVVLELTNENAMKVVEENAFVLLLGYAPWCQSCSELMPRFAEAAVNLREMGSPVVAAKLDADRHSKAAASLGVQGFPSLLLFSSGSSQRYKGGYTAEEILVWTRKKTGSPVVRLSSIESANEFQRSHHIFVIGLFEKFEGHEYEEFVKAATADNDIQFAECTDTEFAKVLFPSLGLEMPFLGLVKNDPERFEKFEDTFEESKILQFIDYNKFPLVTFLNDLNSAKVHSSPIKLQIFIFAEPDDIEGLLSLFQVVARKFKTKIMFVYVDSDEDNLAKPFLTLFGLESVKLAVTAFDNRVGSKFVLEGELVEKNLEDFCLQLLLGTLPPYYKSEPIPESSGLIKKVVGRTFDADVLETADNVFLEVYTPWCFDCASTSKQVEKLAKHFDGSKDLKFARYDASINEHPKLQINNYPTLLFYPAGDKSNPIKLKKKLNLKGLISFVEENKKHDGSGVSGVNRAHADKDEL